MPEPNRPRRLPPDPNPASPDFEVVDDAPPAPKPAPRPAARPAPPPPPVKPRPAPKPAFEVVDETEEETSAKDATTPARKPVRAAREDDDADEDDRPRKKKKPKKKARAKTADEEAEDYHARRLREFEYTWPSVLLVIGIILSFTGAIGSSGVNAFITIGVMVVSMLVTIPATVVALMGIGTVAGINYGRFGPAVLKIAACSFLVNGVYFTAEWFKVPIFIAGPVGCALAFGLFKFLFDLDNAETNTSMGALNVLSFVTKVLIVMILMGIASKSDRSSGPEGDDPPPSESRRDRGKGKTQPPPVMDPDDDPDDDP